MSISQLASKNGRRYLEYKGKPQMLYGVQLKLGDLNVIEDVAEREREIENHFRMSAVCHFPIVCVPVNWKGHIEPALCAGTDCDFVKKCLSYCDKYDLSIQWLWFGSNVCGMQVNVPQDIWDDAETYPRYTENGENLLTVDHPNFIAREKKALEYFLDMLDRLDVNRKTSAIQVENEPDFYAWHTQRDRRQKVIDELGKTVKNSNFKVMTRVNLTAPRTYLGEDPVIDEILDLDGIDCVGVDVYINEVSYCTDFSDNMNARARDKNLPHFAELGANVDVLPQLICDTVQRGGGVLLYELKTARKYNNGPFDFGLYRFSPNEWVERDGTVPVQYQWTEGIMVPEANTADIISLNEMFKIVNEPLATAPIDNIAMILSGEERKLSDVNVSFVTAETGPNAFGMAVVGDDGYLYCFTLADGTFTVSGTDIKCAQIYDYNVWKEASVLDLKLDAKRGCVYRISL